MFLYFPHANTDYFTITLFRYFFPIISIRRLHLSEQLWTDMCTGKDDKWGKSLAVGLDHDVFLKGVVKPWEAQDTIQMESRQWWWWQWWIKRMLTSGWMKRGACSSLSLTSRLKQMSPKRAQMLHLILSRLLTTGGGGASCMCGSSRQSIFTIHNFHLHFANLVASLKWMRLTYFDNFINVKAPYCDPHLHFLWLLAAIVIITAAQDNVCLKGYCKFNPWSNTPWHRPPLRDQVCRPLAYVVLATSETTAW